MSTTLKNIRRSPYQALAAIIVTGLTVFIFGAFTLVSIASQQILLNFETKPQVIAYLKDAHTPAEVDSLIKSVNDTGEIKSVVYVSKDQALEIYKKSVSNDPLLLGTVTDFGLITADILPASVEITAKSPSSFPAIVSVLEKSELVSVSNKGKKEIDFPEDVVTELAKWTLAIRLVGLVFVSVLCLNSIVTIMMVISMKIANRRVEIGTMKLMGAGGGFILKPYLVESVLYGFFGGIVGWLACFITLLYSTPFLASRLVGIISLPVSIPFMLIFLAFLVFVFSLLGLLSGFLAAYRFLKR